jgi:hypothetical protein
MQSIGNTSYKIGTTGGGSDEGGGGKRQRASGSRCGALGDRLKGRRGDVMVEGLLWCGEDCGGLPTVSRGFAGVGEEGGGGVRARGVGREEGKEEWDGHELEKLENRRIEARRGCSAGATIAARCRPVEA